MRTAYRILSLIGDIAALFRGPGAYGRRLVRKRANRYGNRQLRRWLKP